MTEFYYPAYPERGAERRVNPRLSVFWPARVTDSAGVQEAVCYNVSYGGIALYLWSPPTDEELVEVTLELPNGCAAVAHGRVVSTPRGRGRTVGLTFVPRPEQAVEALHAYIDRRFEPLMLYQDPLV